MSWTNLIAINWALEGPPLEAQSRLRFAISHYKLARASFRAQKTKTEVTAELAEMFEAERSSADQASTKQDQE